MELFRIIDTLRPTATGLDAIPAWFLRLGAPVFAAPIAQLFNQSISNGVVPRQWKTAVITPVPKVSKQMQPSDYRPISITPILSCCLERCIVKRYMYPALQQPPYELNFEDQFGFRPSGSTAAAIIAMLHTVGTMLSTKQYVRLFSFDFTKAFDTVKHETLLRKMATLRIPDNIYNWMNDFFGEHYHCTRFDDQSSSVAEVKASVIQGSALGPASYVVTAADFHPVTPANCTIKYANDTYLIVPAANSRSCLAEIAHIDERAATNNLKLNCAKSKSKETIINARGKRGKSVQPPPPCPKIE